VVDGVDRDRPLLAIVLTDARSGRAMTHQRVAVTFEKPTKVRLGVPADQPVEALRALVGLFSKSPEVVSGRLGLMEVLPEGQASYFTYVVGIECDRDAHDVEERAVALLQESPAGRFPISVVPPTEQFLTREAIVFYSRSAKPTSLLRRLLGKR